MRLQTTFSLPGEASVELDGALFFVTAAASLH